MNSKLKKQEQGDYRLQKIMAFGFVMLVAAAYALIYQPTATARASALESAQRTRTQLEESRDRASALDTVRTEVAKLERKLTRYKPLSSPSDLPQFHGQLSSLDTRLSLRKYSLNLDPPESANGYREWKAQITFEASFDQTMEFLRQIESIDRLTRVRSVTLDAPAVYNGLLDVKVNLSLFSSES
jgi:Tfp pilus assembly protein PilO